MNKVFSNYRGHEIYIIGEKCFYVDNNEPTANNQRDCGHCKMKNREDGHDACLGVLPGVMNACCGHGDKADGSYIQFENGVTVRDFKIDK